MERMVTGMEGFLATEDGIREIPKLKKVRSFFCSHKNTMQGEKCSEHGLRRISGEDKYLICMDCGKVLDELHTTYGY